MLLLYPGTKLTCPITCTTRYVSPTVCFSLIVSDAGGRYPSELCGDISNEFADRGFGKPTVNSGSQAPGIGDFTITISDHDVLGNPINPKSLPPESSRPLFSIKDVDSID